MTSVTLRQTLNSLQRPGVRAGSRTMAMWLLRLWRIVEIWQERARQRRQLLELDERLLKDIGVSRADAERIGRKPFWEE